MAAKPPLPDGPSADPVARIPVDTDNGSDFAEVLRTGTFAADGWTFGPAGPYANPAMTPAEATRGQVREALLHLLELGLIDIDGERLGQMLNSGIPMHRETATP